jgi:hypothetical protein
MNTKMMDRARVFQYCVLTILVSAVSSLLEAATFDVSTTVNGRYRKIGAISADYLRPQGNGSKVMEGDFQLNAKHKPLMKDPDCQFRWFQVVHDDTDPVNYLGQLLNAPYTDPPWDGWDYQRSPANDWQNGDPGADRAPFYENDDTTATTYKYPKYSGTLNVFNVAGTDQANVPVHSQNGGVVRIQDRPGLSGANEHTKFWSFLTYIDKDLRMEKKFNVVWGFSWGVNRGADGTYFYDAIAELTPADITADDPCRYCTSIAALHNSGFGTWTPIFNDINIIKNIPEPTSGILILLALCSFMFQHRQRRIFDQLKN